MLLLQARKLVVLRLLQVDRVPHRVELLLLHLVEVPVAPLFCLWLGHTVRVDDRLLSGRQFTRLLLARLCLNRGRVSDLLRVGRRRILLALRLFPTVAADVGAEATELLLFCLVVHRLIFFDVVGLVGHAALRLTVWLPAHLAVLSARLLTRGRKVDVSLLYLVPLNGRGHVELWVRLDSIGLAHLADHHLLLRQQLHLLLHHR